MSVENYDVAIIGSGPAGLQATLILARTRKRIIVFDSPEAPRNGASHGVHNFVGLDGLLPSEIREQAWQQINVYNSADLCKEKVVDVQSDNPSRFRIEGEKGTTITAQHVVLAMGFHDIYPDIPGFLDCWGDTIFTCPFCDGYENRDCVWGLVATSQRALDHLPKIYKHWTTEAKIFLSPGVQLADDYRAELTAQALPIYEGNIVGIHHTSGKVQAVTLDTGEKVKVETLVWGLPEQPLPLTQKIISDFNLELDERGYIKTDTVHQTSMRGMLAVGDIQGWATALGAAYAGSQAAYGIIRDWYSEHRSVST